MLQIKDINPRLLRTNYAVRGPIVQRAQELESSGREIIYSNIGNPQALGQIPLTYIRQTLSLLEYPELLTHPLAGDMFPSDVVDRVQNILAQHPFGTGAYSNSTGISFIRKSVAEFIQKRDGISSNADHIFLTDGASKAVQSVLFSLIKNEDDALLIPIPQYPLYSATLELYGGTQIGYQLDEDKGWNFTREDLEDCISKATLKGKNIVGIVVINPGNPTGSVLSYETIQMVIEFAKQYNISILADEVYQENVYKEELSFISFAKVMHDLNENDVSLFSFHSVSKGYIGECGHRGGYVEMRNIPADVLAALEKLQSISLCSNVSGQIVTYLMINPPQEGDASYAQYIQERNLILESLRIRAYLLATGLNSIEGVSIEVPAGAMYAFVRVELPQDTHLDVNMSDDELVGYHSKRNNEYCLRLLEETGICVVPGSGFGQKLGRYHFRTTFLPPEEQIRKFIESFEKFHRSYIIR
ncbi:MAG: aminotransferase class I/II-fold pyridoxal phosphate-dependent enzyme [bacterium]|nr:aminotransferase class I/II-fold pyridoxal phosphate-dependent enzyme [bacterium]